MKRASLVAGLLAVVLGGGALRAQQQPIAEEQITVREGDTLEAIALRYGTSIEALARLNGLAEPNVLQVGQQLRLPGQAGGRRLGALERPQGRFGGAADRAGSMQQHPRWPGRAGAAPT